MGDLRSQSDLFQIVASFFAQANSVRPLVLLLEDLHWADQASLDLLRYLARAVGAQRLLLVVTYRDDEVGRGHRLAQLLPALVREAATRHLTLPPLATRRSGSWWRRTTSCQVTMLTGWSATSNRGPKAAPSS